MKKERKDKSHCIQCIQGTFNKVVKFKVAFFVLFLFRCVCIDYSSSVSRRKILILSIITSSPIVTTTRRPKPNQPSTMADEPTPLFRLPFAKFCTIELAATDAVCCHSTDTSTNTEEIPIKVKATCDTGREGKGLTSLSEPLASISSCQPGNVARRIKQKKARTSATILKYLLAYFLVLDSEGEPTLNKETQQCP